LRSANGYFQATQKKPRLADYRWFRNVSKMETIGARSQPVATGSDVERMDDDL
jgi:hypothetical protein